MLTYLICVHRCLNVLPKGLLQLQVVPNTGAPVSFAGKRMQAGACALTKAEGRVRNKE